jgi:hypothetical protein
VDELSMPATINKLHYALYLGEQRVVLTAADIIARLDLGPALADQNRATSYQLAAEPLYTQSLGLRVASVA